MLLICWDELTSQQITPQMIYIVATVLEWPTTTEQHQKSEHGEKYHGVMGDNLPFLRVWTASLFITLLNCCQYKSGPCGLKKLAQDKEWISELQRHS